MPLSSDPSVTYNPQGNIAPAGTALAAGATTSALYVVDFSSSTIGGYISPAVTYTAVTATAGVLVSVYPASDSTPHFDTSPMWPYTIPAVASSTQQQSVLVPPGKFSVTLKNQDATNGVTFALTSNPIA